ncbi:hypothetical protein NE237_013285 [Protea cynaroides]|uniref:Uncharacterized protein n=1 Tax=Protea cynaroides TaxID=273540 RepID=A0A9Q0H2P2_9MAGN|nr:hypothetical protein NE237_013285 [Protea cynaroides]
MTVSEAEAAVILQASSSSPRVFHLLPVKAPTKVAAPKTKLINGSTGGLGGVSTCAQASHDSSKGKRVLAEGDGTDNKRTNSGRDLPTDVYQKRGGLQVGTLGAPRDKSIFESCWVARALLKKSWRPRDIKHVEAWTDREVVQRCFWYEKMADSTAGDVYKRLESTNFKLLAAKASHKETKEAYNAQAIIMEKMAAEYTGLRKKLFAAQDEAKGAEGELPKEQEKFCRVEGELCQSEVKLRTAKSDLKSTEEKVVKDATSGYFREAALYLRSCLDEQGIVVDYFVCLSFKDEGENLGRASIEESKDIAGEDHSPDLSMFGAPPQTLLAEEGAGDPPWSRRLPRPWIRPRSSCLLMPLLSSL